jgi:hypothetical protein
MHLSCIRALLLREVEEEDGHRLRHVGELEGENAEPRVVRNRLVLLELASRNVRHGKHQCLVYTV